MRARVRVTVGLLAVAALAGHVAYWYLPRERAARLDVESPAGTLFVAGGQQVRAWLPYPHQNLGAVSRALDDPAAVIAAASRLAGLGEIALPRFGPFALPPSSALAVGVDPGGEHLAVTVEVYPAVALLARLAGTIAGNPILRGGNVVMSGQPMRVVWQGFSWSVSGEGSTTPGASPNGAAAPVEPGLAFVALAERLERVEPGIYRLRREERDLVLASTGEPGWESVAELAEEQAQGEDLAFLGLRADGPDAMSVLVLPRTGGKGLRLPDAAVAWTGGDQRWRLPGERILRLLGLDPLESQTGAWKLQAMDRPSLEIATRLAPALGEAARSSSAALTIWIRPRDYLPLVTAIVGVLDALPIAPPDEVRHWRDLETVLEAVGPVERVRVTLGADGGEARVGWGDR